MSSFLGSSPPAARPWGCAGLSGCRVGNPVRQREQPCRVFACLRRHRREAPCGHAGPPAGTRLGERGELPVAPGGRPRGQAAKRGGLPRLETGTRSGNSGSTAARTRTICSGQSGAPRGPVPGCGARGSEWAGAGRPQRLWVPPSFVVWLLYVQFRPPSSTLGAPPGSQRSPPRPRLNASSDPAAQASRLQLVDRAPGGWAGGPIALSGSTCPSVPEPPRRPSPQLRPSRPWGPRRSLLGPALSQILPGPAAWTSATQRPRPRLHPAVARQAAGKPDTGPTPRERPSCRCSSCRCSGCRCSSRGLKGPPPSSQAAACTWGSNTAT